MAKTDAALMASFAESTDRLRSVMLFARRMRDGDYEINGDTMKLVEDWLFIISMDLTGFGTKAEQRLADYRHVAEAVSGIVVEEDARPLPPFGNILVFTGAYRPVAANDQLGGAA